MSDAPRLSTSGRVVLVEDDPIQAQAVSAVLRHEGLAVEIAATAAEGLARGRRVPAPDLIVLDVMLPDLNGVEVVRRLRTETDVPIILLTSRRLEADKILGLDAGADDYITKPFSPNELLARVRSQLRKGRRSPRQISAQRDQLVVGALSLNVGTRQVRRADQSIELSAREFELLRVLAAAQGRVVARAQVIASVWGPDYFGDERMLDTYVRRLRKKIEPDPDHPRYLHTVRGVGYRLADQSGRSLA
jgi:DNA-binding response OmpR family regulator